MEIGPNETAAVPISFIPKDLTSYIAKFDINVKGGNQLSFTLEGNIPQVEYMLGYEPLPTEPIKFVQVLVGSCKTKQLNITNTGILPAPLAITAPANPDFEIDIENRVTIGKRVQH